MVLKPLICSGLDPSGFYPQSPRKELGFSFGSWLCHHLHCPGVKEKSRQRKLLQKLFIDQCCSSPALERNDNEVAHLLCDLPSGETFLHAEGSSCELRDSSTARMYVHFQRGLDAKKVTAPFQHQRHWRCKYKDVANTTGSILEDGYVQSNPLLSKTLEIIQGLSYSGEQKSLNYMEHNRERRAKVPWRVCRG